MRSLRRLGLLAACCGLAATGCGGSRAPKAPVAAVATPPASAQADPEQQIASKPEPVIDGRYLIARLRHAARLRSRPGGKVIRHLKARTEFGSHTTLSVTRRAKGWLEVITPLLPNHRRGWIPERAATLHGTGYDIRVDRSERRAVLRRNGIAVLRFAVAVGRPGNETPLGRYAVTDKLRPASGTSPYGCCAIALSGHQTRLEPGWPGGDRLAIHGTPATWTVGQAVSLGCMRAHSAPLRKLLRTVPLGAPVRVVA